MAVEIHINHGNHGRARDLALRGLEVAGVDDRLAELAMQAAHLAGDPVTAGRIADRRDRLLDELENGATGSRVVA